MSKKSLLRALAAGAQSGSQYFNMISQQSYLTEKQKEIAQFQQDLDIAKAEAIGEINTEDTIEVDNNRATNQAELQDVAQAFASSQQEDSQVHETDMAQLRQTHAKELENIAQANRIELSEINILQNKELAAHQSKLNIFEIREEYNLRRQEMDAKAKAAAELSSLEGVDADSAIVKEDLAIRSSNESARKQAAAMDLMYQMLQEGKADGWLQDKGIALARLAGVELTGNESKQAVWEMLRNQLAIDELTKFTGATTDFEFLKTLTLFPGYGENNEGTKKQLMTAMNLVSATHNRNVDWRLAQRDKYQNLSVMTEGEGSQLQRGIQPKREPLTGPIGAPSSTMGPINSTPTASNPIPEDYRQFMAP